MKNIFLKISVGFVIFSACQKNIDLKLSNEFTKPKLVLNSLLETDSIISVHVSSSASSFSSSTPLSINDAIVSLYENGTFKEKLIPTNNGYYKATSLLKPTLNNTYEVKISKDGFDDISALTSMPSLPLVTNVVLDTIEKSISFQLADLVGKNYYQFNLSILDSSNQSYLPVGLQTKEKVLLSNNNQDNFNEAGLQQLPATITDELFDAKTATYKVYYQILGGEFGNTQINYNKTKIYFNTATISTELFDYLKSRSENLDNSGNPFSEPVLVISNVQNGYGVLGGKSTISFKLR